jgi:hypothetical protein
MVEYTSKSILLSEKKFLLEKQANEHAGKKDNWVRATF